ncbi:MAG: IS1380 family transposase [Thermomicrobiales bacterium]
MADSPTSTFSFETLAPLALEAAFDGGQLTSDGGLPWLAAADAAIGVCAEIAAHVPEWRREARAHPLALLICQRVYQIACGFADQNDATTLRHDPLLKLVCGRLPEATPLASQPTFSRLENAVSARDCYRIARALGMVYLRERGAAGIPIRIVLDLDSTDDPTHGTQEGTRYHGYYRQHMYHPLLIFDGDTDQLITAVLRPGNAHAGKGIVAILSRIVQQLRATWPDVQIAIRADAGFAVPALYDYCEGEEIELTIALLHNARLAAEGAGVLAAAVQQSVVAGGEKVRLFAETRYQAGSWAHPRRVIYKAEAQLLPKGRMGTNVRFVVTSRDDPPEALYDWYTQRGGTEGWIKDFKNYVKCDRLSCHRFVANQFRLFLHAAAYWLLDTLRRKLVAAGVARMTLETVRLRVVKIGGRVRQWPEQVRLHLATSHPGQPLWHLLAAAFPPL